MNDEAAFLSHLAAHPEDETARGAYADWLDEHDRGEEAAKQRLMGPGYRAQAVRNFSPSMYAKGKRTESICSKVMFHVWMGFASEFENDEIPEDWYSLINVSYKSKYWKAWREMAAATDAVALAFAKLPPERQAELLAYQPTGATM
jgi:uncharacterized protein (TIGR02996 family)